MIWSAVEIGVNLYQGMLMVYFMHVRLRQKPHPQWVEPLFACLAALFLTAQPLLFPSLPDTFVFLIPMALGFMASAERKAVVFMWSLILCSVFIGVVIAFGNVLTALTGREWDALLEQSSLRLVFMVGSNLALTFVLSLLAHIRKQEYSIPVAATVCFFVFLLLEFLINELLYMYQLHSPDPGSALFVYISLGIMASVCLTICLFEKMNKVIRQRRDAEQALYA